MQIREQIFEILRTDYSLREAISDKINSKPKEKKTRIVNIERWGERKSIPSWFEKDVIKVIKRKLKLTDKEIYQ